MLDQASDELQILRWHPSRPQNWDLQAHHLSPLKEEESWWGRLGWSNSFATFRYSDEALWAQLDLGSGSDEKLLDPGDSFLPCGNLANLENSLGLRERPLSQPPLRVPAEIRHLLMLLESTVAHPTTGNWKKLQQVFLDFYRHMPLAGAGMLAQHPPPLQVTAGLFRAAAYWRAAGVD